MPQSSLKHLIRWLWSVPPMAAATSARGADAIPQDYARAVQSISMSNSMGQEATGTKVRDGGSLGK